MEAAFYGGILTSDSGAMLCGRWSPAWAISDRIVKAVGDRRHPGYIRARFGRSGPSAGVSDGLWYEDAKDCNALRQGQDPAFKATCDRLPVTSAALASQPTMSRFENRITRSDLYRIAQAFVDLFIAS